jgi:hypothetical protein
VSPGDSSVGCGKSRPTGIRSPDHLHRRVGLDGWGKSRPPPGFDPRPVASRYADKSKAGIHPLFLVLKSLLLILLSERLVIMAFFFSSNVSLRWEVGEEKLYVAQCVAVQRSLCFAVSLGATETQRTMRRILSNPSRSFSVPLKRG